MVSCFWQLAQYSGVLLVYIPRMAVLGREPFSLPVLCFTPKEAWHSSCRELLGTFPVMYVCVDGPRD